MTHTGERQALVDALEPLGWTRTVDERVDNYTRGVVRIRVIWRGDDAISGGTLFTDEILMSYSRDFATVTGWLRRGATAG